MPTREYTEKERREAKETGEELREECEHSTIGGECLEFGEMCFFEDQKECSKYRPKFIKEK